MNDVSRKEELNLRFLLRVLCLFFVSIASGLDPAEIKILSHPHLSLRLPKLKYKTICPSSDQSIRCKLYKLRLRHMHERKRTRERIIEIGSTRSKRKAAAIQESKDPAVNLKRSNKILMQKQSRNSLNSSYIPEEVTAKRRKITRKYKTYWRFFNGRYRKLPVCNTTAVPPVDITFPPWNSTTHKLPSPPIIKPIPLTFNQRAQLVEAHNEERRKVFPPAKNMRRMTWDDELTWVAESHTKTCEFNERSAFEEIRDGLPRKSIVRHSSIDAEIGFNWYAWENTRSLPFNFVKKVIGAWASEKKYYDFDTRKCQSVCRHFLQMVWAETFKIGCAVSCCGSYTLNGVRWFTTTALICAYAPRGNVLEFTASAATSFSYPTPPRTKYPYKYGPTCEDCGGYYETEVFPTESGIPKIPGLNDTNVEIFIPDLIITTTQRNADSTDRSGNALDYCTYKLCANTNRDRNIPFTRPGVSTTTTFSWTTSLTARIKKYGELECLNPNLFNVFAEDGTYSNKIKLTSQSSVTILMYLCSQISFILL